jgi:hypothetical protein
MLQLDICLGCDSGVRVSRDGRGSFPGLLFSSLVWCLSFWYSVRLYRLLANPTDEMFEPFKGLFIPAAEAPAAETPAAETPAVDTAVAETASAETLLVQMELAAEDSKDAANKGPPPSYQSHPGHVLVDEESLNAIKAALN